MCGIMGYVGPKGAAEILLDGLRRLEYRGYDSAGIALIDGGEFRVVRSKGKLADLRRKMGDADLKGTVGIGHTRWATHGKPSDENAHPHHSANVVVVHNGIIENHAELREHLSAKGCKFQSETDTEIIPFLIEQYLGERVPLEEAVRKALAELQGAFALAILHRREPGKIVVAKNASPLIVGTGKGEGFVASDIPALLSHTRNVVILEDGDMAVIERDGYVVTDFEGKPVDRKPKHITWSRVMAEKEGYKHFMLKEIHEQPRAISDTLRGRVADVRDEVDLSEAERIDLAAWRSFERVILVACGTSYHAAMVAKFWFESLARIPTTVDLASEFRYRDPVVGPKTLCIGISQSGETADTLAAMEEAKRAGAATLAICNVVDSAIPRKADGVLYTHAGPEIGVASTKAFTTQLALLATVALHIGRQQDKLSRDDAHRMLRALVSLPTAIEHAIQENARVAKIAHEFFQVDHFLFLGRGTSYPIAMEGALKLKEISYIHAEGYAGGEIKHGPIALVDEGMPVVVLASGGSTYGKIVSNLEEIRARGARIIGVITHGDEKVPRLCERTMEIPRVDDFVRPILEVVPLQLLAYHIADRRGTDVDQPRNLAKSVTVE